MKGSRILTIVLVALGAAGIGWFVWGMAQPEPPGPVAAVTEWWSEQTSPEQEELPAAVVRRGALRLEVSASGVIEPRARLNLAFEGGGRVAEVWVTEGQSVRAGDPLARLDDAQLALQVRGAEAALAAAEAQLAQIEADARPEQIAAAEAELRASQAQLEAASAGLDALAGGATYAQIAAAEAAVAAATARQRSAEEAHDMTMRCFNFYGHEICPALGPYEEQARYAQAAADAALVAAEAGLYDAYRGAGEAETEAAEADVATASAMRDMTQAQKELLLAGSPQAQIAAGTAFVRQAQVALELAELALERATLYAPIDGVVTTVNVATGQMTGGGAPALMLIDDSRLHAAVAVDEVDVASLSEGQAAEVTLDALPDSMLAGTVERIAPVTANFAPMAAAGLGMPLAGAALGAAPGVVSYEMVVALETSDAAVRAGMSTSAVIVVSELEDVLLIPTWVVRLDKDSSQTYVQRRVGETVERVDIELGVRGEGVVQVLAGLEEGEVVVLVQRSVIEEMREARQ